MSSIVSQCSTSSCGECSACLVAAVVGLSMDLLFESTPLARTHFFHDIAHAAMLNNNNICDLICILKTIARKHLYYVMGRLYDTEHKGWWNGGTNGRLSEKTIFMLRSTILNWLKTQRELEKRIFILNLVEKLPWNVGFIAIGNLVQVFNESHMHESDQVIFKYGTYPFADKYCSTNTSTSWIPLNVACNIKKELQLENGRNQRRNFSKIQNLEESKDRSICNKNEIWEPVKNFARDTLVPIPMSEQLIAEIAVNRSNATSETKHQPNIYNRFFSAPQSTTDGEKVGGSRDLNGYAVSGSKRLTGYEEILEKSWNAVSSAMRATLSTVPLSFLLMEERNIFSGSYNVFVLYQKPDNQSLAKRRVVHTDNFQPWLAHSEGSTERKRIRFFNITPKMVEHQYMEPATSNLSNDLGNIWLTGHAGSVRALWLDSRRGFLLSGSYDTNIRLWDLSEQRSNPQNVSTTTRPEAKKSDPTQPRKSHSRCVRIYQGHTATVRCLWMDDSKLWFGPKEQLRIPKLSNMPAYSNVYLAERLDKYDLRFATGGADGLCCVWQLNCKHPLWTFKHSAPVTAVILRGHYCAAGDCDGRIKLRFLLGPKPRLIKTMSGHVGEVTALRMSEAHLVSGSKDGFVRIWSVTGENVANCLGQMPHPSAVLCLELCYLRVVTGCADGRIRIWNVLTQHCQRVLIGNNRLDPILCLMVTDNRLFFSTQHNVLAMEFEEPQWQYVFGPDAKAEHANVRIPTASENTLSRRRPRSHAEVRYNRARLVRSADPRLLRHAMHVRKYNTNFSSRPFGIKRSRSASLEVKSSSSTFGQGLSYRAQFRKSLWRPNNRDQELTEFFITPPITSRPTVQRREPNQTTTSFLRKYHTASKTTRPVQEKPVRKKDKIASIKQVSPERSKEVQDEHLPVSLNRRWSFSVLSAYYATADKDGYGESISNTVKMTLLQRVRNRRAQMVGEDLSSHFIRVPVQCNNLRLRSLSESARRNTILPNNPSPASEPDMEACRKKTRTMKECV
ncbi:unnamed protein product [Dicrocoelium dendriticum]|nr:unnamed protein product [Dicrocoelium dendriticum]